MGRELKRVPLDFAWTLSRVWAGYLNPYAGSLIDCTECDRTGFSVKARVFADQWYGNASFDPVAHGSAPLERDHPQIRLIAEHNLKSAPALYGVGAVALAAEIFRLWYLLRTQWQYQLSRDDVNALVEAGRLRDFIKEPGYVPTPDEVNSWSLNSWSLVGMGFDTIAEWVCVKARCDREGVPVECPRCKGEDHLWASDEARQLWEAWEPTEPPSGPGFQLWETTSEGSPISPVFETLDALCAYAATNCSTFADALASAEEWRKMLDADFVHHTEKKIGNTTISCI